MSGKANDKNVRGFRTENNGSDVNTSVGEMRWPFSSNQGMNSARQDASDLLSLYEEGEDEACDAVEGLENKLESAEEELSGAEDRLAELNRDLLSKKAELRKVQ